MPVVELDLTRLERLVGKTSKKRIVDFLPYLGLDIESQENDTIRVEYSPNRPDYSTDFGIALGLQGLLGVKKGLPKFVVKKTGNYKLKVEGSVSKVRPFVTGIVAKNGKIDDAVLRQIIVMQEDLHFGIGRQRKKSSIGIHDLNKIEFPLRYTTVSRTHKFVPLNSTKETTISEILEETEVGEKYGKILGNTQRVPIIFDARENTVSFPPIINAAATTVTTNTTNLFVEVTGLDKNSVEDLLAIVATILQEAGFDLVGIKISGAKNSPPLFKSRKINLNSSLPNESLGLNLSPAKIVDALKKCRLGAAARGKKIVCTIPRYRFDIFGPMDLVEEVALGYGIQNLRPSISPPQTLGKKNPVITTLGGLGKIMVGLGFMEALNSSLTSKKMLYDVCNRDSANEVNLLDSKSQEHTVLRDFMIPGLLNNLSINIHAPYPQKLFEVGTVFIREDPIKEEVHLACVSAHKDANFSELKSILQSALKIGFKIKTKTKTSSHPSFAKGRTAQIIANEKPSGIIGEIDSKIIGDLKVRVPVVGFELNLTGLIFD